MPQVAAIAPHLALILAQVALVRAGIMAIVLYTAMGEASWWLAAPGRAKLPAIGALVALGAATYGACLLALGFRPRHFSRREAP